MSSSFPPPAAAGETDRVYTFVTYLMMGLTPFTGVTWFVAVIMALMRRGTTDAVHRSHLDLILGTALWGFLGAVVGWATIWVLGLGVLILLAVVIWALLRVVMGALLLNERRPVGNPSTFMLPA
jgi:uncharacterized membrane protein